MDQGVLFISPDPVQSRIISGMLEPVSVSLDHVTNISEARDRLNHAEYPVILTETRVSDGTWIDVLKITREMDLPSTVIVTDPLADDLLWAEVLNLGAYDLLVQPFDTGEVQRIIANACAQFSRLQRIPQKPVRSQVARRRRVSQGAV